MTCTLPCRALARAIAIPFTLAAGAPTGHAKNDDTHVTGEGIEQTMGTCWAVTVMGSGHTVGAEDVVHDITVHGYSESVFYKNGQPFVWDRGRELGMTNRINHVAG